MIPGAGQMYTGRRVFGTFPTKEDPKSPVIWEAFQPQTEPRRSFRRSQGRTQDEEAEGADRTPAAARTVRRPRAAAPRRAPPPAAAPSNPLPTPPTT